MKNLRNDEIGSNAIFATLTKKAAQAGATIIDMGANPDDFSPVLNLLTVRVKEALAADRHVIVLFGERHDMSAEVFLPELFRRAAADAGIAPRPVMAMEQPHKLLQTRLSDFFPCGEQAGFRTRAAAALDILQTVDPVRYRRAQAMAYAALDWGYAPAARLAAFSAQLGDNADIHLIDLAVTRYFCLDLSDPATAAFTGGKDFCVADKDGMRARNDGMAARLKHIALKENSPFTVMAAGLAHLGGNRTKHPYEYSLYPRLSGHEDIRLIAVFPESHGIMFQNFLSAEAQQAMNNPDTIIVRNHNQTQNRFFRGAFAGESAALASISRAAGQPAPPAADEKGYDTLRKKYEAALKKEVTDIADSFAPLPAAGIVTPIVPASRCRAF